MPKISGKHHNLHDNTRILATKYLGQIIFFIVFVFNSFVLLVGGKFSVFIRFFCHLSLSGCHKYLIANCSSLFAEYSFYQNWQLSLFWMEIKAKKMFALKTELIHWNHSIWSTQRFPYICTCRNYEMKIWWFFLFKKRAPDFFPLSNSNFFIHFHEMYVNLFK